MTSTKQKTIAREVSIEGVGLHTGNLSKITCRPAPADSGIRFIRTDLPEKPVIPARLSHVAGNAVRGTTIGENGANVHTVEHLLAVCACLDIDNLEIQITNNEPPILDGSAQLFARLLAEAGLVDQDKPRRYLTIPEPVVYQSGRTKISAYPAEDFSIECTVAYDHPFLKSQSASFVIDRAVFEKEIAPARTFCFDYEIEALKSRGLARGGDFSNAIVVGLNGIHNPGKELRFPDEFVRHKMLDLIGDLYLTGRRLKARIVAECCGHQHNIGFGRELMAKAAEVEAEIKGTEASKMDGNQQQLEGKMLDINAVKKIIPHRYPFLMIDKVMIVEEMKKATGFKCVSGNENFFQGHFPGQPIMPGVLIVEAMAQTSCVLFLSRPDLKDKLAFFMGIDGVKFRKPVVPGDVLELRVEVLRARDRGGKVRGEAYVNGTLVTEAEFMFVLVDREA